MRLCIISILFIVQIFFIVGSLVELGEISEISIDAPAINNLVAIALWAILILPSIWSLYREIFRYDHCGDSLIELLIRQKKLEAKKRLLELDPESASKIQTTKATRRQSTSVDIHPKEHYVGAPSRRFHQAVRVCLSKYVNFSGRASRSEYWYFLIFALLAIFIGVILDIFFSQDGAFASIVCLILFLPILAVGWRRMHDINRSGWWVGVGVILGLIGGLGQGLVSMAIHSEIREVLHEIASSPEYQNDPPKVDWSRIAALPEYQSASPEEQRRVQEGFFNQYVLPEARKAGVNEDEIQRLFFEQVNRGGFKSPKEVDWSRVAASPEYQSAPREQKRRAQERLDNQYVLSIAVGAIKGYALLMAFYGLLILKFLCKRGDRLSNRFG